MVETHIVKVEVHIIEIVIVVLVIASVIIIKVQIMRIVHPYINVLVVFLPAQWSSEETFRERKTHTEYHLLYVSPGHVFFFFPKRQEGNNVSSESRYPTNRSKSDRSKSGRGRYRPGIPHRQSAHHENMNPNYPRAAAH